MPTYLYFCGRCHYTISNYQKKAEYPIYGHQALMRITGGNRLIFKGDGFYTTDYAKKDEKDRSNRKISSNTEKIFLDHD